MLATAKLFKTGHSQAVRLPKEFRLPGREVWIHKNEATGEITLKPKPDPESLEAFIALLDETEVPDEFMQERRNPIELPSNPFVNDPT